MDKEERLREMYLAERERLSGLLPAGRRTGEVDAPVFGEGPADARTVMLGEAPGAEETLAGRPFVGKAGRQLDELLSAAGIDRKSVYVTNTVKYRPVVRSERSVRNRTPSRGEREASMPLLRAELETLRPKVLLTLGNVPLQTVLSLAGEKTDTVGNCHGVPRGIRIGEAEMLLIPLYHPASVIYNRSLAEVLRQDMIRAGDVLRSGQ